MAEIQSTNKLDRGCQQQHHFVKGFASSLSQHWCVHSTQVCQVLHVDPKIHKNEGLICLYLRLPYGNKQMLGYYCFPEEGKLQHLRTKVPLQGFTLNCQALFPGQPQASSTLHIFLIQKISCTLSPRDFVKLSTIKVLMKLGRYSWVNEPTKRCLMNLHTHIEHILPSYRNNMKIIKV